MDFNYSPSERQRTCRYAHCYAGRDCNKTRCRNDKVKPEPEKSCFVTAEQCETCPHFKSKYIEYPITVDAIEVKPMEAHYNTKSDSLVRIQPCGDTYEGKTYLGVYLGDLPWFNSVQYNKKERKLSVHTATNPAIYVPELKKIIYGCESWWQIIESPEDCKELTRDDINDTWFMQLLGTMIPKKSDDYANTSYTSDSSYASHVTDAQPKGGDHG